MGFTVSDRKVSRSSDVTVAYSLPHCPDCQEMFPDRTFVLFVEWITVGRKRKRNKTAKISVFTSFVCILTVSAFSQQLSTLIFFPDYQEIFSDRTFVLFVEWITVRRKWKRNKTTKINVLPVLFPPSCVKNNHDILGG